MKPGRRNCLVLLLCGLVCLLLLSGCARTLPYPEPNYLAFQEGELSLAYPDWTTQPDQDPETLVAVSNGALAVWLRTYPGYPQFALRLAEGYIKSDPQQKLVAESGPDDWPLWLEQDAALGEFHVRTRTTYYFRVRGVNSCSACPWSNVVSARTK